MKLAPSMTATPIPMAPEDLAARLAARLCHDVAGKISGLTFGLDLMAEARDDIRRQEAISVMTAGLKGLNDLVGHYRLAFGRGDVEVSAADLEGAARALFEDLRPTLDWRIDARSLPAPVARIVLHLVEIAGGALASGGVAMVSAVVAEGDTQIRIEASGPRVKLRPGTLAGLGGEAVPDGQNSRWIQAWFLQAQVAAMQGSIAIDEGDEAIAFRVSLPTGLAA
jgi:hypothetical protein